MIAAQLGTDLSVVEASASDADGLSVRQRRILAFIRDHVETRGYPPSIREIADIAGMASPSSAAHQLRVLERKGFLVRDPHHPRALTVRLPASMVDNATDPEMPESVAVPLLGQIAAGAPILAEESFEDVWTLPKQFVGEGSLFLLEVKGDSMVQAAICSGDFVVVRRQPVAESGEIVAALIGDEATVKTLKRVGGKVWLMPQNPAYDPIDGSQASILGKVVAVLRRM
jgi:repressor LexA